MTDSSTSELIQGKDFVITNEPNPTPRLIGEFLATKSKVWRLGLDPMDDQIQKSLDILSQVEDKPQAAQKVFGALLSILGIFLLVR